MKFLNFVIGIFGIFVFIFGLYFTYRLFFYVDPNPAVISTSTSFSGYITLFLILLVGLFMIWFGFLKKK